MHIGLIGGIGPAATDFYYRSLIAVFAVMEHDLDLTMAHADSRTLLGNVERGNTDEQVAIYMRLTERLAAAGADCVVISSIAGHFCIDAFKPVSPLPVVNMIEEVGSAVRKTGIRRVGILGTRTVMESRFYGGIEGVEIVPPGGGDLDAVHRAYVDMAASGVANDGHRAAFEAASRQLLDEAGAEAIMLGGTDLALVYDAETAAFPLVDCASIHVDAVMELATK